MVVALVAHVWIAHKSTCCANGFGHRGGHLLLTNDPLGAHDHLHNKPPLHNEGGGACYPGPEHSGLK